MVPISATRIWCNVGSAEEVDGLVEAFTLLGARYSDLQVHLTGGRTVSLPKTLPDGMNAGPKPYELFHSVDRFLTDRAPHMTVLTGTDLFASAITACVKRHIPLVLANARISRRGPFQEGLANLRLGSRLRSFQRIFAVDQENAEYLVRKGAPRARIDVLGMLQAVPPAPACDEGEREYLSKRLSTRPVLLAAELPEEELPAVEAAYRSANRQAHRLLLVVNPANLSQGSIHAHYFEARGWITARREAGEEPDPNVQVFVADAPHEAGLWYRLASLTFLGGTLTGAPFVDPFQPASLGSAVLHGTALAVPSPHLEALAAAAGCRGVADAEDLGAAVADLLAPDRAAALAARAWDAATHGAEAVIRAADAMDAVLRGHSQ